MRFRDNRKLDDEDIKEMKRLKETGLSYKLIGRLFNVSMNTAIYHLKSDEKDKKRQYRNKVYQSLTKEEKRERAIKNQGYLSEYIKDRYNKDDEFRKKFIKIVTESFNKRREVWIEKDLCRSCGRERINKRWLNCEKCREVRRKRYKKL